MLPRKEDNIYPRTIENIETVLFHYFNFPISEAKKYTSRIYDENKLELNQIEYIAKRISEHLDFFRERSKIGVTINEVMGFGIAALTEPNEDKKGSPAYKKKLKELRKLLDI